jgi:hypothetical protein
MAKSSDVAEISRIFRILKSRKVSRTTTPFGSIKYAQEDTRLFQRQGDSASVELWSLSPSSASITRSLQEFAEMVPVINSGKGHLPRQKANDVAVALFLQVGDFRVLLGSDLQSDTASDRGWRAVIAWTARPQERAHIFKVPHHEKSPVAFFGLAFEHDKIHFRVRRTGVGLARMTPAQYGPSTGGGWERKTWRIPALRELIRCDNTLRP